MNPQIRTAIESVYEAFADVSKPLSVDGCPCCIDEKGISILLSKPLRELSPDELTHYAASVFLTVGTVEDFFYFLPRILEILVIEPNWWPSPEVVARALDNSKFHNCPVRKFEAVSKYFDAIIAELLDKENSGYEIDGWICALGRLRVDLKPFLNQIAAKKSGLIDFYEANSDQLIDGRLRNSFWNDAPQERKFVVDWFQSAEIKKAIELAYGLA
jgi:hypothetical protein